MRVCLFSLLGGLGVYEPLQYADLGSVFRLQASADLPGNG